MSPVVGICLAGGLLLLVALYAVIIGKHELAAIALVGAMITCLILSFLQNYYDIVYRWEQPTTIELVTHLSALRTAREAESGITCWCEDSP